MATSQRLATLQHVYIVFYQEICSKQPCQNAGSCVRNSCEPDGYVCICNEWYYGKRCESENSKADHA